MLYTCSFSSPWINMRLLWVLWLVTCDRVHVSTYVCDVRDVYNWQTLIPLSRPEWNFNDAQNRKPIRLSPVPCCFARWFYAGNAPTDHVFIHKLKRIRNNYISPRSSCELIERILSSARWFLFNVCPIFVSEFLSYWNPHRPDFKRFNVSLRNFSINHQRFVAQGSVLIFPSASAHGLLWIKTRYYSIRFMLYKYILL